MAIILISYLPFAHIHMFDHVIIFLPFNLWWCISFSLLIPFVIRYIFICFSLNVHILKKRFYFHFEKNQTICSQEFSCTWSKAWKTIDTSIAYQKRHRSQSNALLTRWYWLRGQLEPILTTIVGIVVLIENRTACIRTVAPLIIPVAAIVGGNAFTYCATCSGSNQAAQCTQSIDMWYAILLSSPRVAFAFFIASTIIPAIIAFATTGTNGTVGTDWFIHDWRQGSAHRIRSKS